MLKVRIKSQDGAESEATPHGAFAEHCGLPKDFRTRLIERGLVFLTEFKAGDGTYCGSVIAASFEQAAEIAKQRNLGEEVLGQLVAEIPA